MYQIEKYFHLPIPARVLSGEAHMVISYMITNIAIGTTILMFR